MNRILEPYEYLRSLNDEIGLTNSFNDINLAFFGVNCHRVSERPPLGACDRSSELLVSFPSGPEKDIQ